MKLGTELLLKEDSFGYKKGEKVLYLRNCHDSGYYCVEAVVVDDHYTLLMKELGCDSLEQALNTLKENSLLPVCLDQFAIRFTTIKPKAEDVCCIEDLINEEERLIKRLEYIQSLKSLMV